MPKPEPTVTDPRAMRALAHPVRMALLEFLGIEGTATATRCAEELGESQANCSFHLRQLAKYGFVEGAPSQDKRERPWRLTTYEQSWGTVQPDAESTVAAHELSRLWIERQMAKLLAYERNLPVYPPEWRQAGSATSSMTWLTREELEEISAALSDVIMRHVERLENPSARPEGAQLVQMFAAAYPAQPIKEA